MNSEGRARTGGVWFWLAVLLFLAAVIYVIASTLTGTDLTNARDDAPLFVLGSAALILLAGWWRDRSRLRDAEEAEQSEYERPEGELREREDALREARAERDRVRESEEEHRRERQNAESRLKQSEDRLSPWLTS